MPVLSSLVSKICEAGPLGHPVLLPTHTSLLPMSRIQVRPMTVRHNKHTSLPVLLPVGVSKDPQTTHTFVQFHYTNRHCTAIKLSKAQVPHTISYSASPTAPMCNVIEYRTEGAFGGQALMGLSKMRTSFPLSLSPPALSPSPSHPAFSPSALLQRSVLTFNFSSLPKPSCTPASQTPLCHHAQQEGGSDLLKKYFVLLLCGNSLRGDKARSCAGTETTDPTCLRTQTLCCRSPGLQPLKAALQTFLSHSTSKHSWLSAFHSSTALLKLQRGT